MQLQLAIIVKLFSQRVCIDTDKLININKASHKRRSQATLVNRKQHYVLQGSDPTMVAAHNFKKHDIFVMCFSCKTLLLFAVKWWLTFLISVTIIQNVYERL